MKVFLRFVRTTLVGGLLFLLPIVVVAVIIGKALALVHKVVDPLAAHIPVASVLGLRTPVLLAVAAIIAFCFAGGLAARSRLARGLVARLEDGVLSRIPGYGVLKSTGENLLGVEGQAAYPVVLVRFDDAWQIGFRTEDIGNGLVAVYIPGAPSPQSGTVCFMESARVMSADIPTAASLKCLKRLGVGSKSLLGGVAIHTIPAK